MPASRPHPADGLEVVAPRIVPTDGSVVAAGEEAPVSGRAEAAQARAGVLRRIVVGIALAMGLFEVVLRHFYYIPWVMDPEFGCMVVPGVEVVYRREGSGTGRWTEQGVRRATPLPAGARPILAVGDSFTEAYMLDDDQVFTARAEAALAHAAHPIPVLNAGSSGLSSADYVADAPRNLRVFQPRWVVIQLRDDDLEADAWGAGKTRFARQGDGTLSVVRPGPAPRSELRDTLLRLRAKSALLNYTIIRALEFQQGWEAETPLFRAGAAPEAPPAPPSYPITQELDAMAEAYGGRVTFLLLAGFDPARPGEATGTERVFQAWCRAGGRSCVNLRDAYQRFADGYASPYGFSNSGFNVGHLNAEGHAAAGGLLASELERLVADGLL